MTSITKQSGILPWQATNIASAPSRSGVYVLRTATEISSIIYIGSSDSLERRLNEHFSSPDKKCSFSLERRLNEHFLSGDVPGVLFFDWYETGSLEDARNVEKQWIIKYSPKYNERVG